MTATAPPPPGTQEPHPGADGLVHSLDPRYVPLQRLVSAIVGLVLAVVSLVGLFATSSLTWFAYLALGVWVPFTGLLAWLALRWPSIDYRHWRYRVDADALHIWRGVVWREAIAVPRSRVQHIDVSQGPLERSYGLASLSVYTAGTHYSRVDLPGLDHAVALAVRDALLPKDAEPAV